MDYLNNFFGIKFSSFQGYKYINLYDPLRKMYIELVSRQMTYYMDGKIYMKNKLCFQGDLYIVWSAILPDYFLCTAQLVGISNGLNEFRYPLQIFCDDRVFYGCLKYVSMSRHLGFVDLNECVLVLRKLNALEFAEEVCKYKEATK